MNETIKFVGVKPPTYYDVLQQRKIEPTVKEIPKADMAKEVASVLLTHQHVLVNLNGSPVVIERGDKGLVQRRVEFHPLAGLVGLTNAE